MCYQIWKRRYVMRLIGVDPGKLTGVCSLNIDENKEIHNVEHLELDPMGYGNYIEQVYKDWRVAGNKPIVVCESFIITAATAKKSPQPYSLELIGVTKFFMAKAGIQLVFQTPAQAKRLASNDILKAAGLYKATKGGHAADSARHLCYYLMTEMHALQDAIRATM